jgi:hypothetical protein
MDESPSPEHMIQWIGFLGIILTGKAYISWDKSMVYSVDFPLNQSISKKDSNLDA